MSRIYFVFLVGRKTEVKFTVCVYTLHKPYIHTHKIRKQVT